MRRTKGFGGNRNGRSRSRVRHEAAGSDGAVYVGRYFRQVCQGGYSPLPQASWEAHALTRWKWSEIVAVLDGGATGVVTIARDAFEQGAERAKEAHP
jgi:hypothetical protein